jgi:hypothetical protein
VCGSALGSVWQCVRQCAAVLQCSVRQCSSMWQCGWLCAAVRDAVCGSARDSVRRYGNAVSGSLAVYDSARGCVRQCAWQCAAVFGRVWQCVRQCVAVRAAVCDSVHVSMRIVPAIVCSSALGSVWQCAQQCATVRQCGSVRRSERQCVAVCTVLRRSARSSRARQCDNLYFVKLLRVFFPGGGSELKA